MRKSPVPLRWMMQRSVAAIFAGAAIVAAAGNCYGVDPYSNTALAPGYYLSVYPSWYRAPRLVDKDGTTVTDDLRARAEIAAVRLTAYDKTLFSNTTAFTLVLPAGRKEALGDRDSGIGDVTAGVGHWIVDDPASGTWILVGVSADLPSGGYDKTRKANMGGNVKTVTPVIGFSKISKTFEFEGALKYTIFEKNAETGVKAGDLTTVELYGGYFLRPQAVLAGVLLNGAQGNDSTMNGATIGNSGVRKFQAGPSFYCRFTAAFNATVDFLTDFGVRNGAEGKSLLGRLSWRL